MALFEALYRIRCRSSISWFKIGEATLLGPDSVHKVMEKYSYLKREVESGTKLFRVLYIYEK